MGLFDGVKIPAGLNSFGKPKVPPGQKVTAKFPVLTYGDMPAIGTAEWRFEALGEVEQKRIWTWDQFMQLPQTTIMADFHCVTHWSRFGDEWSGVLFADLIKEIRIKPGVRFVLQHAYGGYTTNLPLDVMLNEEVMFAHTFNGEPLPQKHGGPMRVFTPRRYAWKGAKWIRGIEFLTYDRPGFWEQNGYNTPADPWKEERYG